MHDPMTVAFDIPNPFAPRYQWADRWGLRPSLITIWHVNPRGDQGFPCGKGKDGETRRWWRWHFWHWQIQIHPLQRLRRWAFERCFVCGKGYAWGYSPVARGWDCRETRHHHCDPVNISREHSSAKIEDDRPV